MPFPDENGCAHSAQRATAIKGMLLEGTQDAVVNMMSIRDGTKTTQPMYKYSGRVQLLSVCVRELVELPRVCQVV